MYMKIFVGALVAACLAVAGAEVYHRYVPGGAGGGAISRDELAGIIRTYIVDHPEVLQEAMAELDKRQAAADTAKAEAAIKGNEQAIFSSPHQITVAAPQGDVTLVEFFDYNCGYCKRAMDDMVELMKTDPKLRVVLKEFPVLGPGSVEAAQVAVAVRMQDPDGQKYLAFHLKLLGGRGQADKAKALAAARDAGIDMDRLQADLQSTEVKATLEESFKLAELLGINGTPSYVVGDNLVIGAVGLATLRDKVRAARCAVTTTC